MICTLETSKRLIRGPSRRLASLFGFDGVARGVSFFQAFTLHSLSPAPDSVRLPASEAPWDPALSPILPNTAPLKDRPQFAKGVYVQEVFAGWGGWTSGMLHQGFRAETPIEYYEDPLHMTGPRPEYDIRDATVRARLLEKARAPPDADVGMGHALRAATGKDWGQDCSNAHVCMVPPAPHVSATPVLPRWLVSAELFPWVHLFLARRCPGVTAHHTHVPLVGPIVSRPLVLPSNTQSRCVRHGAWRSAPHSSSGTGGSSIVALSVRSKCIHRGFWRYKPCPPQTVRLPTHPPRGEKAGGDREPSPSVHTDEGEERNRSRQTRSAAVLHAVARNRSRQIRTLAALDAVARSPDPLKPGTSAFGAVPSTRH